ncbi:MAG: RagB/SusD family nutrient uptake outer membrane protein, partial [Chloroflexi bacterium]
EHPQTFVDPGSYFKTGDQAIAAVNGIYGALMTWDDWIDPAWQEVTCEGSDIFCPDWWAFGHLGAKTGTWFAGRTWTANYLVIRRANDVLGQLDRVSLDPTLTARLRGEAHFLRAYAYFELVRRYRAVPLRLTPYVPDGTFGDFGDAPRVPVEQVYPAIVNDLKAATQELPPDFASKTYSSSDRGRPTAFSAWGLLAKVYLTMAGAELTGTPLAAAKQLYDDSARTAAQHVMQSGWVTLEPDYMRMFDGQQQITSDEILFQIGATHQENTGPEIATFFNPPDFSTAGGGGGGFLSMRQAFYTSFDTLDRRIAPGYAIFAAWKESYSSGDPGTPAWYRGAVPDSIKTKVAADSQIGWTWTELCDTVGANRYMNRTTRAVVQVSPRVYSMKYIDRTALTKSQNQTNPIILRYADVLLAFAEAENEVSGPTAAAYAAINQVRTRSNVPNLTLGLSPAQFRDSVWLERRHELYGEFQEWFDLKREGRWLDIMNDVIPAYPGSSTPNAPTCRPRQAYQMLLPIPDAEIGANRRITQNPGY